MVQRILFVCLGNICRSPTAEAVFDVLSGSVFETDSAGTSGWHIGDPPYGPMQTAARTRGYDLSKLRARQIVPGDFAAFDLIVAMDRQNLRDVEALRPNNSETLVRLFTDFGGTGTDVPDPYYTRDFDQTLDIIEASAANLMKALKDQPQ